MVKADMLKGMEGKTKMEELKLGDCNTKPYMKLKSLKQVRDTFRARTHIV